MPRKPEPLEPWMLEAIELIVRRQLSLRQAASQLGVDITPATSGQHFWPHPLSGRARGGTPRLLCGDCCESQAHQRCCGRPAIRPRTAPHG